MDGLLTPVSTTFLRNRDEEEAVEHLVLAKQSKPPPKPPPRNISVSISSADEAIESLRSQPDYPTLVAVLTFLSRDPHSAKSSFSIHASSPQSAALVQTLVTEIAPNYWALLSEESEDRGLFVQCLQSLAGVNAILSHIRVLTQESKTRTNGSTHAENSLHLGIYFNLLAALLEGDDAVRLVWDHTIAALSTDAQKRAQSQALLTLLASGRLVSLTGEASTVLDRGQLTEENRWIGDGSQMSVWIGRNIITWARLPLLDRDDQLQFCSSLFQRSLSLGYPEQIMRIVIDELLLSPSHNSDVFRRICFSSATTTNKVLRFLLVHLAQKSLDSLDPDSPSLTPFISAAAGIINSVVANDESRKQQLIDWCTASSGAGLGHQTAIRRAVLSALAQDKESIVTVFEQSISQFGDELYIRHAAVMQQNIHAEILLLTSGYLSRLSPVKLAMTLRSGLYLSAISNRIASTQARPRFLGMVVGECLSSLVDKSGKALDFHMDDKEEIEEAKALKSLAAIDDKVGSVEPLLATISITATTKSLSRLSIKKNKPQKSMPKPKPKPAQSKAIIQEVVSSEDEDEDDDDDLVPYQKNSDPDDSDEDPELVQRNKIKPPVYVRDLIAFLRDSESYDKQKLALETAPVLIRRKANYGTEVSSHADELAGLLVGIQDKFEMEGFSDQRLQGIVALIVSQPTKMAPWFARTFFEGDFSLSQRSSILVALGVSARELGGFGTSKHESNAAFPSKKLPEKIEQLYISSLDEKERPAASRLKAIPATALDSITKSLTSAFLDPIAADAADAATGPDALKLETFTARYKSKTAKRPRVRAIPNTTAAVLSGSFFSPLTAHFQVALRSSKPFVLNPALLGLYLQTLGVIIHAAGPSTLSLPQLTSELWTLLLRVRQHVLADLTGTHGWLVAMAALLAVNEGDMRRLCEMQGREVVETREWVSAVFEKTRGEDGGEENEVKMLAAGVLIRLGEAIERYQALLMGDMIGFS